jgi:phosphoribosylformimino-5-aminoimidazole carboxamide ribotide isomerase
MRIIIALDIIDGKCVRLTRGDYSTSKIYSENPLDIAKQAEDHGFKYLHLVDLDGARNKRIVNYAVLEAISSGTSLKIDFGGGIRTSDDLKTVFNSGANQVTVGSISITDGDLFLKWLEMYGPEKIVLGADSLNRRIATGGWMDSTDKDIIKFISDYCTQGIKYAVCTDIEKDGMLKGPSINLYNEILEIPGINLIASGGISTIEDIKELSEIGCEGAIIGKALYEGILNLKELSRLC